MSIPLVQDNNKDAINTSIIAIKRNIERINMLLGLSNSEEIDTSEFVKKSDIVDVVEAGNMNPVTSNAVVPVDEVTSGNMQSVTSNAVAVSKSYSTTEQKTGGVWIDGKPIYEKVITFSNYTFSTGDNSISHGISNLGQLTHFEIFNNQSGLGGYFRLVRTTATTITLNNVAGYALSSQNGFIILEYTKTTD